MLRFFGADVKSEGLKITVAPCQRLSARKLTVPADISSAAFFIGLTLVTKGAELLIKDVGVNPTRSGIITVLQAMGGDIRIENRRGADEPIADIIVKASELKGAEIGGDLAANAIDELPLLAAVACFASGKTTVKDAAELRHKECDRIDAMYKELKKLGADIEQTEDGWVINPAKLSVPPEALCSHADHRIAMSLSVALSALGGGELSGAECVAISFPTFYELLDGLN